MLLERRGRFSIMVSFQSFQSLGGKELDVGDQGIPSDSEVGANDLSFNVLSDEKDCVVFFAHVRIRIGKLFLL